ncbi:MAG: hypothetical protein V3V19_09040 [Cocleimonas sp.]
MKSLTAFTLFLAIASSLIACSSNKTTSNRNISESQLGVSTKVETGIVLSVKTINLKGSNDKKSYGNVGVSVGTGGNAGLYGTVDVATIGRFFSSIDKPTTAQEIIIKKENGDTVAITQATKAQFKKGDKIKVLLRSGKSVVIH